LFVSAVLVRPLSAQSTQPAAAAAAAVAAAVGAAPTSAPAAAPAVLDKDMDDTPDPSGANGGTAAAKKGDPVPTGSLLQPNNALPGWAPGTTDPKTNAFTAKSSNLTNDDMVQLHSKAFFSINITWTLICGYLVMFMQAGFALVETGLVRGKNAAHTMAMNFMIYAIGMFGFFICGFAFMCGGANGTMIGGPGQLGGIPSLDSMWGIHVGDHFWGLCGHTGFFLTGKGYDAAAAVWFLFEMVFMDTTATIVTGACAERWSFKSLFMDTTATIVTGACAERWSFKSFFVFSMFIGAVTYPIFGCWVWGGGWLAQMGQYWGLGNGACDYAGSGVVHLQGGALAFITSFLLGPRLGKYDRNGKLVNPIAAHNVPMVMLGSFILAFGWFGFNPGSSLAASDNRIGIVATNTMLAGMSATMFGTLYMWWFGPSKKPDPCMMCNQLLAGLVAITAPSGFVSPMGAFWIGAVAGVLVCLSCFFFDKIRVDDPVGAISIHGTCGAWGVLAVGLFADGTSYSGYNGVNHNVTGLFYGGGMGQLAANGIEVVVNIAWNVIIGGMFFYITGLLVGGNRVSAKTEIAGLDMPEMGALGYPEYIKHVLPDDISDEEVAEIKDGKKLEPSVATLV
jgi:Amt family ammonium transporter